MHWFTPRRFVVGWVILLPALALLVAACSGGDGGGNGDLPEGWKSFSTGPFKGGVEKAWTVTYADFDDFDFSDLPEGIPEDFKQNLENIKAAGEVEKVFLVFLDKDPAFATNINILSCEAAESVDLIDTTEDVINLYGRNFVNAEAIDKVTYNGTQFDLIQLFLVPQFDSYQVYLKTDDCYTAATLTTRSGDKAQIESFKEFLLHLKIDAAKLQ
ncbi:MAG TPA: hypothetical protein VIB47_09700 [Dehalococcoidia bacterium]